MKQNSPNYITNSRDKKVLKENCCKEYTFTANDLDVEKGYRGLARGIIRNKKVNIGKLVGINRLEGILADMNNDKKLVEGQEYKTLSCGCK